MRFTPTRNTYPLKPESVDAVSERVQAFLQALKAPKKNIIEARLTVEEILLDYLERYDDEREFTLTESRFLGKASIVLSVKGEPFNPLEKDSDEEFGNWTSALIANADYVPSYAFSGGINTVTMRFSKKEINPMVTLLLSIGAAVLLSMLRFLLPEETVDYISNSLLTPFYNAFIGLMTTVAIPLVFLSVACGIVGIGDSTVFGKIGRKMVLRFVGVTLFFTALAGIIFSMLFVRFSNEGEGALNVEVGVQMLLDLIPVNLVDPLITGNTMQIVVMAIVIATAVVVLGDKAKTMSKIINEGNRMIVHITGIICKLMPVFIVIVILHIIWSDSIETLIEMWKPLVAFILVSALMLCVMLVTVAAKENVKVGILVKKMLPTFLIGFGTASSVAANGECSESLYRRMGVYKRFVEFGQPTGGVVFMPATAINFMACTLYMAARYHVKVSLLWFVFAVLVCTFVAVATPPVPGGALTAYAIIFSQFGIPDDAVAIMLAMDILFDFAATAFDGAFLQLELLHQADENNMLDYEVLRKP